MVQGDREIDVAEGREQPERANRRAALSAFVEMPACGLLWDTSIFFPRAGELRRTPCGDCTKDQLFLSPLAEECRLPDAGGKWILAT
jgi:hypothetical protein